MPQSKDKEQHSEIELLTKWKKQHQLAVALFDFDDTLIQTQKIFKDQMERYAQACAEQLNLDPQLIMDQLKAANNHHFLTEKTVHPGRWKSITQALAVQYPPGQSVIFSQHLDLLQAIYTTQPEFHEGAKETLDMFRKAGFRLGLVTHASAQWTYNKLKWLQLMDTFETVTIAPEDQYKDAKAWQAAVESLNIDPVQAMAIGDNLQGDISAARNSGIQIVVWIPSNWKMYTLGDIPEGTIEVKNGIRGMIGELLAS